MLFEPYADECTSFENVRVLKFDKEKVEVSVKDLEFVKTLYKNTKPFKIYFNTHSMKVMNTLQEVRFTSDKTKIKRNLGDLVEQSDIERLLKKWVMSGNSIY